MQLLGELIAHAMSVPGAESFHELATPRLTGNGCLVVLASDRGLCGGFNNHIVARVEEYVREKAGEHLDILIRGNVVARKGSMRHWQGLTSFDDERSLLESICNGYLHDKFRYVDLLFTRPLSGINRDLVVKRILPVGAEPETRTEFDRAKRSHTRSAYAFRDVFWPSPERVLTTFPWPYALLKTAC